LVGIPQDPKVSIIIPCKHIDSYVEECIRYCLAIDYPSFELLLLPDSPLVGELKGVKTIATGPVKPAGKRNLAMKEADGEFYAFIDSDAYPGTDWLKTALEYFHDPDVAGVGGPGITPEDDSLMQKASGAVYSSMIGGFRFAFRYSSKQLQETDDLPSCNLIVRASVFKETGGFDERFLTGEDTRACMDIVHNRGKRLIYAPNLVVYHHRRPLFKPHLRQVWTYARHRGLFARVFPKTSGRVTYFIPSVMVAGLIAGLLLSFIPIVRFLFALVYGAYLVAVVLAGVATKNLKLFLVVPIGIFLTHLTYGLGFLSGLISRKVD
jgi:cellulose synthase/poly-beta-1,6-N-acetylglucosamine synthase-like glycosyltransferase